MDIFVTGSSGWVGFAVVCEVINRGHTVRDLIRTPDKASRLVDVSATSVTGSLDDVDLLAEQARLPSRSIAAEDAAPHFSWLAPFALIDVPASAQRTTAALDWNPAEPDLLQDILAQARRSEGEGM